MVSFEHDKAGFFLFQDVSLLGSMSDFFGNSYRHGRDQFYTVTPIRVKSLLCEYGSRSYSTT